MANRLIQSIDGSLPVQNVPTSHFNKSSDDEIAYHQDNDHLQHATPLNGTWASRFLLFVGWLVYELRTSLLDFGSRL